MTIFILTNNDVGLYAFRHELLEYLCKRYQVTIVLPYGEMVPALEKLGCRYIPFDFNRQGMNPFADIKQLFRYVCLLQHEKPDVVLTYTIKPNVYGGLACRITRTPYIANITGLGTAVENGRLLKHLSIWLYKIGLKKANCVFFQNSSNQKIFIEEKVISTRSRLIPGSGVNLQAHSMEPYPPCGEITRFLFVGRIMKDKGIEELLSAMYCVKKTHSNIFLDIVGPFDDDYSKPVAQAVRYGLSQYHGSQQNVHQFYRSAHCVVLPSYHEGMANVLLEAAATGRPVIATDIPGCREAFEEGRTGLSCKPKDVDSLVFAMKKFLALPQKQREEMGKAGREKMEQEFDRSIVIQAYAEEIERVAQRTTGLTG